MTSPLNLRLHKKPTLTEQDLERQAVAKLVAHVRDEAHWAEILSTADADQRAELESVVAPLLPFRRAAPCTTPDCGSTLQGIWQPVLEVRSPFDLDFTAHVPIELHLCATCKADAQVGDFLTDGIWSQILSAWPEPKNPPVQRLTTLGWDRIH